MVSQLPRGIAHASAHARVPDAPVENPSLSLPHRCPEKPLLRPSRASAKACGSLRHGCHCRCAISRAVANAAHRVCRWMNRQDRPREETPARREQPNEPENRRTRPSQAASTPAGGLPALASPLPLNAHPREERNTAVYIHCVFWGV